MSNLPKNWETRVSKSTGEFSFSCIVFIPLYKVIVSIYKNIIDLKDLSMFTKLSLLIIIKGKTFYFNVETNESQWNHPLVSQDQLAKQLLYKTVKCSHIIIKSRESRKPFTLQDKPVTISRQEAMNKILGIEILQLLLLRDSRVFIFEIHFRYKKKNPVGRRKF